MGKDLIKKYLAYDGKVAVTLLDTTNMVEEARKIHDLSPVATAALGRLLTAVAILGQELKNEDEVVTVQIKGGGPIGQMCAVANNVPEVKGYVQNPHVDLPLNSIGKLDVGGAVGNDGLLTVIKDISMKEPYVGITPLVSGEIAEDFARYFVESEQKNNAISLGVLVDYNGVKRAGGYQIALMPDVSDEIVTKLEENLKNNANITNILEENQNLDDIAVKITGDVNIKQIEENDAIKYHCNCNKNKFEKGLISLGKKELEAIIKEEEKVETVCHFCGKKYTFDNEELEKIIQNL
jgi:molecular chaperone Hsp33